MRKLLIFLMAFVCLFSLTGCGKKKKKAAVDEYENHKKVLALVDNYSAIGTNGFDYSLEQKLDGTVVNAHTISIRLDNSNGTIGSRVEYKKDLNEDTSKGQYTEVSATAYYKNNKIATYVNNVWTWKNCTLDEFLSINIGLFTFDINSLSNLSLSTSGKYAILSFKIDDSKAASFLGVSGNIKNLSFEIKTDDTYSKLISFKMSYSQNLTSTYYNFAPYSGSVNVDIPA